MVKGFKPIEGEVKTLETREVCLDRYNPVARTYEDRNILEQVTVPDVSPSLYQMVSTATVGSMPGNSPAYQYPELGTDDEAHDHPDYEKLNKEDIVLKEEYVEKWLEKAENYEKAVESKVVPEKENEQPEKEPQKENEPTKGGE